MTPDPNHLYIPRRPVPQRGGSRSSRTRGGMRWTRAALLTRARACGRRSRVVLMPRRWHQIGERQLSPMTGARKPGPRGERAISRKTIARGMPGVSGVTVVTNACAFYHTTRGCGRIERPAFPAPSVGGEIESKTRAKRCGEIAKPWVPESAVASSFETARCASSG